MLKVFVQTWSLIAGLFVRWLYLSSSFLSFEKVAERGEKCEMIKYQSGKKYTMLYKLQIINIINFTAKACNMLL